MVSLGGMASGIGRMMGGMGIAAGGMALIAVGRAGEQFNRAMQNSLAIMGEVSDKMQGSMVRAAEEAGRATMFSNKQAAESYFFLASAGLSAEQSIAALPQVALFAQAGMFDMARATDLATDAQSALGMTVKDAQQNLTNMSRVTDVLVKANTLANASVEQFSLAITNKAGAAAKIVGKDIEELTSVLAAFADQGLKSSEAGTAVNIVFRELQTRSIKNRAAFEKYNVTVFDSAGEMRNTADIIRDLEEALHGMSDEQKKATLARMGFQDKSMIFLQTLIGTSEKMREYEKELRKAGGTTKEVADKQLTPFQKGWAGLTSGITAAASAIMKLLGPPLGLLLAGIGKVAKLINIVITAGLALPGMIIEVFGIGKAWNATANALVKYTTNLREMDKTWKDSALRQRRAAGDYSDFLALNPEPKTPAAVGSDFIERTAATVAGNRGRNRQRLLGAPSTEEEARWAAVNEQVRMLNIRFIGITADATAFQEETHKLKEVMEAIEWRRAHEEGRGARQIHVNDMRDLVKEYGSAAAALQAMKKQEEELEEQRRKIKELPFQLKLGGVRMFNNMWDKFRNLEFKMPDKKDPLLGAGRFGARDFGNRIQDALLKKEDPLVKKAEVRNQVLQGINAGVDHLNKAIKGAFGLK